jgi:hypothetical protein
MPLGSARALLLHGLDPTQPGQATEKVLNHEHVRLRDGERKKKRGKERWRGVGVEI